MKKLATFLFAMALLLTANSCHDNSNIPTIAVSGNGAIQVATFVPVPLLKLVVETGENNDTIFLLGGTASVDSTTANLTGTGPIVYLTIPASGGGDTLTSMNVTIDGGNTTLAYSTQMSFDNSFFLPDTEGMSTLSSGTAVITVTGSWYNIQILGEDIDGDSVKISYAGYLYASFNDL